MSILKEASIVLLVGAVMCSVQGLEVVHYFTPCPVIASMANFTTSPYLGTWYENRKYFVFFELGGKCIKAIYNDNGNDIVGFRNEMTNVLLFNKLESVEGVAKRADPNSLEGSFSVKFDGTWSDLNAVTEPHYQILDTDYGNYSVVWACKENWIMGHTRYLWILTRERQPSSTVIESALQVVGNNGLDVSELKITDQTGC